jgi:hypothetical protein
MMFFIPNAKINFPLRNIGYLFVRMGMGGIGFAGGAVMKIDYGGHQMVGLGQNSCSAFGDGLLVCIGLSDNTHAISPCFYIPIASISDFPLAGEHKTTFFIFSTKIFFQWPYPFALPDPYRVRRLFSAHFLPAVS